MVKSINQLTQTVLCKLGKDGQCLMINLALAVSSIIVLTANPVCSQSSVSIPASKIPPSPLKMAKNGVTVTSWTGMESNPRYLDVELSGKRANAVFVPSYKDCYCRTALLEKLGIPISEQPIIYEDRWDVFGGHFTTMCPMWQPASVGHRMKKVWILPLNITVGTVERRGVPVIVKLDDGDVGQEEGIPVDRERIVIGNSFFEPGTFALKDNAIEYKGPLSVTVDNRRVHNPRLSRSGGAPLAPLSKQEVVHKEAVASEQRRKAESDVADLRAKENYKQGESPRTGVPTSKDPSEIDLAKALALLKASPTINQHDFENVSQLVLKKIADEDILSICQTKGMWVVVFHPKGPTGHYVGNYDSQGNDLRNLPPFPNPSAWSTKCPLNSNELKPCLELLNKLGPDSVMNVYSGTLHFNRQLKPTKETEIGGCTVSFNIDGKGILQARFGGIVPH